ncbi:hybrid sensor histidine kinase/response regulator [Aetokthonos hydrillicola Thurmond2011]|jgi:signal transduction histidine kinase|uniref:histidine kinase n=1 Tax=Aetokthonos hydrillicola Thurmond2011 TaxID=2712845 RepID=A0AAP5M8V6_9CYAN|nr:hybrid sensor histidine kinase/response regulator [Aetokthonos hydrillicola]MBO3457874.1 hybrid sensor histidine kinase/response regulator [Aetokthonos hydrillicola CCALA 1050]MBW4587360.1 hybrid sensor histidine kinase/response regulator [Aetokthonos hydrillicola CCALA 1050]MDR9896615.1 hybrid sensor histidine kinase/response regulator [Aetokthonos hydrillicola Thurmond2011]
MAVICTVKILLIEDNLAEARLLQEFLIPAKTNDFHLVHVKRLAEALQEISHNTYDVVLLDLTLPDSQGLASLAALIRYAPNLPIVVLTNTNDDELALEAVRSGAQDYLVKRLVKPEVLIRSLRHAIERKQALEKLRAVNHTLEMRVQERTDELVKVQELSQSKSEFVSMLSHDIRNPLNTILLVAGLLQSSDDKLPKEKKLSHFQLMRSAIKNVAQLLDEVMFIGKADTGKLECELIAADLELFCHQIVQEMQLSLCEERPTIIFSSFGEIGEVMCDESLLQHILTNLLSNAIKYSPPNSTVRFDLIGQEKTIIFRIQDEGYGIPEEDQHRIFQPFHRATNVGRIPGTGLGLAIVKKCVETHGGNITVHSEVGVGTTFTVTLPLNR